MGKRCVKGFHSFSFLSPLTHQLLDTGRRVRRYCIADEGQGSSQYGASQYAPNGYQPGSFHADGGIEEGMRAMNLQQQSTDPYSAAAPDYTTLQAESQTQGRPPLPLYNYDSCVENIEIGLSTNSGDLGHDRGAPQDYHTTPRLLAASSGYQGLSTSTSGQLPQPPFTYSQRATNVDVHDRANFAHQRQTAPAGTGYGFGGDAGSQNFDIGKDKYVAAPHSGDHSTALPSEYPEPYADGSYHGASSYGQCKTPTCLCLLAWLIRS